MACPSYIPVCYGILKHICFVNSSESHRQLLHPNEAGTLVLRRQGGEEARGDPGADDDDVGGERSVFRPEAMTTVVWNLPVDRQLHFSNMGRPPLQHTQRSHA